MWQHTVCLPRRQCQDKLHQQVLGKQKDPDPGHRVGIFRYTDTYAVGMGQQKTGPGYWRAAPGRLELFLRNPELPAEPFRPGVLLPVIWVFLLLLGGLVTYIALAAWIVGEPVRLHRNGVSQEVPAVFLYIPGVLTLLVPFWHLRRERKDWQHQRAYITATPLRVEFFGQGKKLSLPWDAVRGFRVVASEGKDVLQADLLPWHLDQEPELAFLTGTLAITGVPCVEPHSSAYALNHLLGTPSLRQQLGSPRSEADINSLLAAAPGSKKPA